MRPLDLLAPGELLASRPACPYEPLIGSWDIEARWFAQDGSTREAEGEWHFEWILGGWGVQDVLFVKGSPADQRGTSIRCYDESGSCWRVVWMAPRGGEFVSLTAQIREGSIIHEGDTLGQSGRHRWTISEINPSSFIWRGETSGDGAAWQLEQEMHARRRTDHP